MQNIPAWSLTQLLYINLVMILGGEFLKKTGVEGEKNNNKVPALS